MTKVIDICPNCGSHLIVKDGQFGEFLACPRFPECRYTKPIRDNETIKLYQPPSPYCDKCNHTGRIPSKVLGKFSGKPIPNCWTDCECKDSIPEHYESIRPEDFDYPMSDIFRAFSFEYCGQPDTGYNPPVIASEAQTQEIIHRHSDMGKNEFNLLQQTASEVKYLRDKINEIQARKPKGISTYKGIK